MSNAISLDEPFSLSCVECDTDSPDSYEDAVSNGWTNIEYFPKGDSENFLGLCPDCRRRDEEIRTRLREVFEAPDPKGGDPCPT